MIKRIAGVAVATLAVSAGTLGLASTPAQADAGGPEGKVISKIDLTVRSGPSTSAKAVGSVKPGKTIPLGCKVRGTNVDGNNRWYRLPGDDSGQEWVSARYVANVGKAPPWCGKA